MQELSNFKVYNASAGSGKTFTLVKEYLKILLQSENIFHFQKILAITFTNKAAGEMKERVLKNLHDFSEKKENALLPLILEETSVDRQTIQERSKKILDSILQNYAAFSITTIDSFTHKIIKSFAYDLGLSLNFEVEMDASQLLNEAVDVLISKIGTDEELTKVLIDYSLDKADDDKSWDISRELNDFAKILLNEGDAKHFKRLASKTLTDFYSLKEKIIKSSLQIEGAFKEIGEKALELIKQEGLDFSDFAYSGECPNHFKKLTNFKYIKTDDLKFSGRIDKNFSADKNLFATKVDVVTKEKINTIYDDLRKYYLESKELFEKLIGIYTFNQLALKSIIPLAVLNNINSELNNLKEENNIRLNAEFNQLIAENIKDQPTPFIYERIGQRFMHYFIDEMQDTSVLQWQNLIPLIDNALSQEKSSLLLVGDGKQAIYRWRGGKAEQFIELSEEENPFPIQKQIEQLSTNYRSYSEIITFNNNFFQHTAKFIQNQSYKNLFIQGNKQLENNNKGGNVSITLLEKSTDKEEHANRYPKKVLEKINDLKQQFSLSEICILVRKKKEGVAIANYLSENRVNIVSSETLLLSNSPKVNFIIDVLQIIQHPLDEETRFKFLYFLHEHLKIQTSKHLFLSELSKGKLSNIFTKLKEYGASFELNKFHQLPLYEKIEAIIRGFNLLETSNAYIQFFLDIVLEQQKKGADIQVFLDFWVDYKDKLSIVAPKSSDAVQIMTIHKSKGLEFPIVIFPCDVDIYKQINPKIWFDNIPEEYNHFQELLINYNKNINQINDRGAEIYDEVRSALELDNFNLLYVALTRPVEQLHIITDKNITKQGENTNYYSGIFINYLKEINQWNDSQLFYEFGNRERVSERREEQSITENQEEFISTPIQNHNILLLASSSKLWDTEKGSAIEFGNLIHEILAKIKTEEDILFVIKQYKRQGLIVGNQVKNIRQIITNIVNHSQLKQYYQKDDNIIYNERELIAPDNQIYIPDRLVFRDNNVTILDYKTGKAEKSHHQQINTYATVLSEMQYVVEKKILIYINEEIIVEEI